MFDLQVNGYGGVDFNTPCRLEDYELACRLLQEDGVASILATVITAPLPRMLSQLAEIRQAREQSPLVASVIQGLHIEGPFISPLPGYVGAHPTDAVQKASIEVAEQLLEAAGGLTRLVTLAPEHDEGYRTTAWLHEQKVVVSAGHCNPTLDQLKGAIDAGLTMFTHLGNGCPETLHRHDNIIQRALSLSSDLWCCFIPDGVHLPFFALKNALQTATLERSIVVTDAISAARLGPGTYTLGNWQLEIGPDLVARPPGADHFVGSTVTFPRIQKNLKDLGFSPQEIDRLASQNPRKALAFPPS